MAALKPLGSSSSLSLVRQTLINKVPAASAWIGSYRIRDPQDFLDTFPKPKRWPRYNEIIQPPQLEMGVDPRPATFFYSRANIKSSPKKMWYVMKFIRGLNIDEAIKQTKFMAFKPAQITAELLQEAQEIAVKDHNFEFKSNMWIEDAKCVKGLVVKGVRKHARMRFGEIRYFYSHVCIKLTEGEPPKHFYRPPKDGNDHLKDFYDDLRSRKIYQGL